MDPELEEAVEPLAEASDADVQPPPEAPEVAAKEDAPADAPQDEEADSFGFGEEPELQEVDDGRELVPRLQKLYRQKAGEVVELKKQVKALTQPAQAELALGQKPTLEACDYDADKFERDLEAWHERKRVQADSDRKIQDAEAKAKAAWSAAVTDYRGAAVELKVKDFDQVEQDVLDQLGEPKLALIVKTLRKSPGTAAKLVAALASSPKKLSELAAIADLDDYAVAIGELKTMLKVTPRKSAPLPERTVRGSAPLSGAVDQKLERLEAEADRTGDRTKVIEYKRSKRQAT